MMLPLEETLDDNLSLSPLLVAPWSQTLGLAGPAAAAERMLPAAGQVQARLGQYSGNNCLLDHEAAVKDYLRVCNMLSNFIRKPNVAILYKGKTLKRLLDLR
ncbi:unnamed protein product [Boreogadus saida]